MLTASSTFTTTESRLESVFQGQFRSLPSLKLNRYIGCIVKMLSHTVVPGIEFLSFAWSKLGFLLENLLKRCYEAWHPTCIAAWLINSSIGAVHSNRSLLASESQGMNSSQACANALAINAGESYSYVLRVGARDGLASIF